MVYGRLSNFELLSMNACFTCKTLVLLSTQRSHVDGSWLAILIESSEYFSYTCCRWLRNEGSDIGRRIWDSLAATYTQSAKATCRVRQQANDDASDWSPCQGKTSCIVCNVSLFFSVHCGAWNLKYCCNWKVNDCSLQKYSSIMLRFVLNLATGVTSLR